MSELTELIESQINNHRVAVQSGTPDYRKIREIEKDVYGEPITQYPGEWNNVTKKDHWEQHTRRALKYPSLYGETVFTGCLWCEDGRRDRERISRETRTEIEAKMVADQLRWYQSAIKTVRRVPWYAWTWLGFWLAMLTVLVVIA